MSNPKPINQSAYESTEEDKGLWKVGSEYHEIDKMDDQFIITAFYHALSKIGEHGNRIAKAITSIKKFREKMEELHDEMKGRGKDHMLPCTPEEAIKHGEIKQLIREEES